jgi:type IV secretory pathway TrbF-like protein
MDGLSTPPTGYEYGDARRQYVEPLGWNQVVNRHLILALLCVSAVVVALTVMSGYAMYQSRDPKLVFVRLESIGRATALNPMDFAYTPQENDLKYFLDQFIVKHFARIRATVRRDYAESLYFLDGRLADATIATNNRKQTIEQFLASSNEEVDIDVSNVSFEELRDPPFRATVDFDRVYYAVADHTQLRRERSVAHVVFLIKALSGHVPQPLLKVNPLGLTVTYMREDVAFR